MELNLHISALRALVRPAAELQRSFCAWWLRELFGILPSRFLQWLLRSKKTTLILAVDQNAVTLDLQGYDGSAFASERLLFDGYSPEAIDSFLQRQGLARNDVIVGLRLPADRIFSQRMTLPIEAEGAVEGIVTQSLSRAMPFKLDDIYFDYEVVRGADTKKLEVWRWVARRRYIHEVLTLLRLDLKDIAFVGAAGSSDARSTPKIDLRSSAPAQQSWIRKSTLVLSYSAVALVLVAGGLKYWRQQTIIDQLASEIATAKVQAERVRALVDKLQERRDLLSSVRARRSVEPGVVDLWAEVTRLLPLHSWVNEFRLVGGLDNQQQISLSGHSAAAPGLIGIFDSSPMLTDAVLTAPIALDPVEGRERFALKATVQRQKLGVR